MKDVERFETVSAAADACVARNKDREAMINDLEQTVRADHALLLQITEVHLHRLCADLIADQMRKRRDAAVSEANSRLKPDWRAQQSKSSQRLLNSTASLFDFVLICGTPLKSANVKQIRESAVYYKKEGKEKLARGKWLDLIANHTPADKTPGAALKPQQLQKFWEQAHA